VVNVVDDDASMRGNKGDNAMAIPGELVCVVVFAVHYILYTVKTLNNTLPLFLANLLTYLEKSHQLY